jgi:hypothetical protein
MRGDIAIDICHLSGHALDVEQVDGALARCGAHTGAQAGIGEQGTTGTGQRIGIGGRHYQSGLAI